MLKSVSAVLGLLSMVPGLQWLAPIAMAAVGVALGIDVILKVTTGKGSWTSIGIDATLTFLPLGKVLKLAIGSGPRPSWMRPAPARLCPLRATATSTAP